MKSKVIFLSFFCSLTFLFSKSKKTIEKNPFIKTILFSGGSYNSQFPIIKMNQKIFLSFDDVSGEENFYYYKIVHCNFDWSISKLLKSEYLSGNDNNLIENTESSYGTLQRYTNYKLSLPNRDVGFKISGNYILEILDSNENIIFRRKFLILNEKVSVELNIYPSQNKNRFYTHQNVQFIINTNTYKIRNPNNDIKITVIQNDQWDNSKIILKPQFIQENRLIYRYDKESEFEGGNEYLFFDTKDLRSTNQNISFVRKENIYQHFLYTDNPRSNLNYSNYSDFNGNFIVQTTLGENLNTESDYSVVYFSLAKQFEIDSSKIYIYGKFNNYELTEENEMIYNPSLETFEGILLLKQGLYNYKYVIKKNNMILKNQISGSFFQTENSYTVLVYKKGFEDFYDNLIGVGRTNSFELKY
tara:strand:- start:1533 stop:2777 length:1245 start_codon:yes stop_codon:yes gene_type:complete